MIKFSILCDILGVSSPTLRRWSKEFSAYLSPGANPGKNVTRTYTEEDADTLQRVADMRAVNATMQDIHASLAAGDRGQFVLQGGEEEETTSLALVTQMSMKAANLEGELTAVREERDRLREENKQLRQSNSDELSDAKTAAAVAERELEIMRALAEKKKAWWR